MYVAEENKFNSIQFTNGLSDNHKKATIFVWFDVMNGIMKACILKQSQILYLYILVVGKMHTLFAKRDAHENPPNKPAMRGQWLS